MSLVQLIRTSYICKCRNSNSKLSINSL